MCSCMIFNTAEFMFTIEVTLAGLVNILCFATTNQEKVKIAQTVCADANITVTPITLEIDEIQGEDPEVIVQDKARRSFEAFEKPVVVCDDSWNIKALNGLPRRLYEVN